MPITTLWTGTGILLGKQTFAFPWLRAIKNNSLSFLVVWWSKTLLILWHSVCPTTVTPWLTHHAVCISVGRWLVRSGRAKLSEGNLSDWVSVVELFLLFPCRSPPPLIIWKLYFHNCQSWDAPLSALPSAACFECWLICGGWYWWICKGGRSVGAAETTLG